MAELNSDLPQVAAQGAVGGVSPNIEAITAAGRGLESAGQNISEGGSYLYRKSAQEEQANVYADMAAAREKYTENLNNALLTGNLDTEQFSQDLKDNTDKIGEGLSTAEGRNFFQRQQARLTGAMLLKASHISGQISANDTVDKFNQGIDSDTNTAAKDPTQFPDIIDKNEELISGLSNLSPQQAEKLRLQMHEKIAAGAARGLAEQDPGKKADGTPNENRLLATLKGLDPEDKDDPSNLYRYLNADQISNLEGYAKRMDTARGVQEEQVLANQEKLQRLKGQVWLTQNKQAILTGAMDPKAIISNPNLTIQEAEMATKMVREHNKWSEERDPGYINSVENKIINGQINSRDQLTKEYNANPIKMGSAYWELANKIDKTPDGHIVTNNIKQLYDMGNRELEGSGPTFTAEGAKRNYNFRQELNAAASNYVQSGQGSLRDFYSNTNAKDPNSPLAIMNKYRMNATERAQAGANEAMGIGTTSVQYSTSPTKDIPPPKAEAPSDPGAKREGESISAWKKRPDSNWNKNK